MNSWICLAMAIFFEVCGTTSLKISYGFSKPLPSIATVTFYLISFYQLAFALKDIEVGIAYAIWSGVGTALVAIIGFAFFNESISALKITSLVLIIAGVIGLHLAQSAQRLTGN